MPLLKVVTVENALSELTRRFSSLRPGTERIPVSDAFGRFLAAPAESKDPVPHFDRSTMDGYAVRASETSGASETIPALLRLAGEVFMGEAPSFALEPGTTAYVPTGGMIPEGADAVVMVEYSEVLGYDIALMSPASPGLHVVPAGRDIRQNERLFDAGRRLGAADMGVLSAAGIKEVEVYRKPAMTLLSTGDEIMAPEMDLRPGKIRDINSSTIKAEAERMGYRIIRTAVIPDDRKALEDAVRAAMADSDILFLSGGSSAGKKDFTTEIFNAMGEPGCFVHGIAFSPGKPTILADAGGFPLVGLPGHPVSSLTVFRIFGRAMLYLLNGSAVPPVPWVEAVVSENIHASPGRDTYKPVSLKALDENSLSSLPDTDRSAGYLAEPVGGGSSMITTLSQADGYIVIGRDSEGIPAGTKIRVYQF